MKNEQGGVWFWIYYKYSKSKHDIYEFWFICKGQQGWILEEKRQCSWEVCFTDWHVVKKQILLLRFKNKIGYKCEIHVDPCVLLVCTWYCVSWRSWLSGLPLPLGSAPIRKKKKKSTVDLGGITIWHFWLNIRGHFHCIFKNAFCKGKKKASQ